MKFNAKILSLLLAVLVVLAPLTGCYGIDGGDQTEGSPFASTPIAQPTQSTPEEGSQTPTEPSESPSAPTETPNVTLEIPTEPSEIPSETPTDSETDKLVTPTEPVESSETSPVGSITILKGTEITLEEGKGIRLAVSKSSFITDPILWTASGVGVTVDSMGYVTAISVGDVTVTASAGGVSDSILVHVVESTSKPEEVPVKPTETVPRGEIHEAVNSQNGNAPAASYGEALERTQKGQLSGYDYVPDQAPIVSQYRPMQDGKYVKNSASYYDDVNTYVVIDAYGREAFRVYRGGAYISLEEVAAYVYAFGTPPANHSSSKKTKPTESKWGIYLRVNNTKFSGDTSRYPYEPELPRISGCGGDLTYWEMDVGTTGTDCDPSYSAVLYNNGTKITRGAARLVYTWNDLNGNKMADSTDVIFVFYTYNHYNDFCEYLNYYGGWGETFGNITGGGTISDKYDCNPTDYVPVVSMLITSKAGKNISCTVSMVDPVALKSIIMLSLI